jgi:hypothetical protein
LDFYWQSIATILRTVVLQFVANVVRIEMVHVSRAVLLL